METREIGVMGGAVIGTMIGLSQATGQAVKSTIQHQQNLRTIGEWSRALDRQRQARITAEREMVRLTHENEILRQALIEVEEELAWLRQA